MIIEQVSAFDGAFFRKFVQVRNTFYQGQQDFLPETLEEFQQMLQIGAAFERHNRWSAWIMYEEKLPVGRVFASRRTDELFNQRFIPFGFFEAQTQEVASKLIDLVREWAQAEAQLPIRGPIQGNAFHSSRLLLRSERHFFSEPFHRPEYVKFFEESKLKRCQHWISLRYGRLAILKINLYYLTRLFRRRLPEGHSVRTVDFSNWDRELELMYHMLMQSFAGMDHVERITFDEFKFFNGDLRKLIRQKDCLIMNHGEKAVAFMIVIKDQLRWISRCARWAETRPLLSKLALLILALRIKLGIGRSLILYLGKVPSEGKGQKLAWLLYPEMLLRRPVDALLNPPVLGLISDDSPTHKLIPLGYRVISEYTLFDSNSST